MLTWLVIVERITAMSMSCPDGMMYDVVDTALDYHLSEVGVKMLYLSTSIHLPPGHANMLLAYGILECPRCKLGHHRIPRPTAC